MLKHESRLMRTVAIGVAGRTLQIRVTESSSRYVDPSQFHEMTMQLLPGLRLSGARHRATRYTCMSHVATCVARIDFVPPPAVFACCARARACVCCVLYVYMYVCMCRIFKISLNARFSNAWNIYIYKFMQIACIDNIHLNSSVFTYWISVIASVIWDIQ